MPRTRVRKQTSRNAPDTRGKETRCFWISSNDSRVWKYGCAQVLAVPGIGWYTAYQLFKSTSAAAGGSRLNNYLKSDKGDVRVCYAGSPKWVWGMGHSAPLRVQLRYMRNQHQTPYRRQLCGFEGRCHASWLTAVLPVCHELHSCCPTPRTATPTCQSGGMLPLCVHLCCIPNLLGCDEPPLPGAASTPGRQLIN